MDNPPDGILATTADKFHEEVAACGSCEDVAIALRRHIAPFGLDAAACGYFQSARKGAETYFYFQDWPKAWIELYLRENLIAHDFGVAEARLRFEPLTWAEAKSARVLTAGERRVWQLAHDFGWREGLFVPLHGPMGYFGLLAVAGRDDAFARSTSAKRLLQTLAIIAHDRCRRIAGPRIVGLSGDAPTARELECLRYVGAGLSDPEIARRLDISANTVKGYVDAARVKLKARSRAQAVALALFAGLL